MKILKKLQQQSSQKTEVSKSNAIMEQLDESDGNRHIRKNNINHFAPLYESDYEEDTKHREKPKTPIIVPSEKEKGRKIKEVKTIAIMNMERTGKRRQRQRCMTLILIKN